MEVAPKLLREVEFPEKLRGYHPDHVDEFLEQVAIGVEQLQERLRQATERADRAEAQVSVSKGEDDLISRTLLVAQRSADMVVAEANEKAEATIAGAQSAANQVIAEAQNKAIQILKEAESAKIDADARARLQIEEGEKSLAEAMARLAATRKEVSNDLALMRAQLIENRDKAIDVHAEAIRWLQGAFPAAIPEPSLDTPARPAARPMPPPGPDDPGPPTQEMGARPIPPRNPDDFGPPTQAMEALDEADEDQEAPMPTFPSLRARPDSLNAAGNAEETPTEENTVVGPASGTADGLHRRRP